MGRDITRGYSRSMGGNTIGGTGASAGWPELSCAQGKHRHTAERLAAGPRLRRHGRPDRQAVLCRRGHQARTTRRRAGRGSQATLGRRGPGGRHTKTNASLVQLIEEHLKTAEVEETTKDGYRANLRKHIGPQFNSGPAAEITAGSRHSMQRGSRPPTGATPAHDAGVPIRTPRPVPGDTDGGQPTRRAGPAAWSAGRRHRRP